MATLILSDNIDESAFTVINLRPSRRAALNEIINRVYGMIPYSFSSTLPYMTLTNTNYINKEKTLEELDCLRFPLLDKYYNSSPPILSRKVGS